MDQNRPLGPLVSGWTKPTASLIGQTLQGAHVVLEPLNADAHAALLFREIEGHDWLWDYMPNGPFVSASQFYRFVRQSENSQDPLFLAIRAKDKDKSKDKDKDKDKAKDSQKGSTKGKGKVVGFASLLNNNPVAGSIEVGFIMMSPALQQTPAATEAMFLLMQWAFEAGYRRYEWKCNALNMPSRRAAQRLGFSYEGVFRQAQVVKGRNRDTAWFAIIDSEWPALKEAFSVWLSPANFNVDGKQRERLSDLTGLVRATSDPAL